MSLFSTANKVIYSGNGATTVWPFSFPVLDAAHLSVIRTDNDGVETELASALYTTAGIGNPAGGSITYPLSGAPLPAGQKLTLLRSVPYVQDTVLSNQGGYYPEVVEDALDRLYMALQQHDERLRRGVVTAVSDPDAELALPTVAARAGKVPAFDEDGNLVVSTMDLEQIEGQPALATAAAAAAAASAAAAAASASSASLSGTSASAVTIGTGSKSFTASTGKNWAVGTRLIVARTAAPSTHWMVGQVIAYDGGTGALTIEVASGETSGSGTYDAWTISLTGQRGTAGADGAAGTGPTGSVMAWAGLMEPSGWLFCYGQAVSRSTYSALFAALTASTTVTITIASPGVVTWTGHTLKNGDKVSLETTGALPTGLVTGTDYFVVNAATNTFQLAASFGGSAINTSGSQSGTHTARHNPFGCGDGSTTFNIPDLRGRTTAGRDDMGGSSANRLTGQTGGIDGDVLGHIGGTETHTLSTAQMPAHTHSTSPIQLVLRNPSGGSYG
ncbi:MAG TPA: tail fiber protein, partial [Reyranellaceae bacterium]|nr:tail fiber protein [Reyranellaceae bacterium]